jgi:hypothetical protein
MSYADEMDEFFNSYVETALWSTNDESTESGGDPLDKNYTADDIAPETKAEMRKDCENFVKLAKVKLQRSGLPAKRAGHDFWLTRNGHGAGFWDEGLGKLGDALTRDAKSFGSYDLYVGDDGKIYGT